MGRKRICLALAVLAILALLSVPGLNATWVYQELTGNGEEHDDFTPTVEGNHYHQAKAPSVAELRSDILGNSHELISRIDVADGVCERYTVKLDTGLWYSFITTVTYYSSGTGQAWVADPSQTQIPACSQTAPGH